MERFAVINRIWNCDVNGKVSSILFKNIREKSELSSFITWRNFFQHVLSVLLSYHDPVCINMVENFETNLQFESFYQVNKQVMQNVLKKSLKTWLRKSIKICPKFTKNWHSIKKDTSTAGFKKKKSLARVIEMKLRL